MMQTPVEQRQRTERPTPSQQPRIRRRIAAVVAGGVLVGVAGASTAAYVVQRGAAEDLARGRAADSARLQGQADAYLPEPAIEQGRAADAERLQAQAEWWLRTRGGN